jgi:hypothetical protein
MNLSPRLPMVCLLLLMLTACTNAAASVDGSTQSDTAPDADAVELIAMSERATQIAQKESPNVILRQVDTDLSLTAFRFVDSALTKEIVVIVPQLDDPTDKWNSIVNTVTPLLTYAAPDMNLQSLKIGPKRVAQAITAYWPGCVVRGITLNRQNDKLTWEAFCNTNKGVVSGSIDNETGIFQPSKAPPAPVAPTAALVATSVP